VQYGLETCSRYHKILKLLFIGGSEQCIFIWGRPHEFAKPPSADPRARVCLFVCAADLRSYGLYVRGGPDYQGIRITEGEPGGIGNTKTNRHQKLKYNSLKPKY
jgi:hypothetical protein